MRKKNGDIQSQKSNTNLHCNGTKQKHKNILKTKNQATQMSLKAEGDALEGMADLSQHVVTVVMLI